jgi:probable phosphoglycerate mutase
LQASLGSAYAGLLKNIYDQLDRSAWASYLGARCREDFEACAGWLPEESRGWYANRLGWVLQRLGDRRAGTIWMEQALELAQAMADQGFSGVCTSPLRRSAETAEIIAEAWGMPPPTAYEGLKERNFGLIQGQPKSELAESHPGLYQEILRRNPAAHFDEGESLDHFADRVIAALHEVAEQHVGERVLIITHGWVMDVITRHLSGLPRTAVLDLKRKNGESIWLELTSAATFVESDAGNGLMAER